MKLKKTITAGFVWLPLAMTPTISFAQGCFQAAILSPSPFMGNDGEIFKIDDGSMWQVKYEYEYLYEYNPDVVICPSQGKMIIGESTLNIEPITSNNSGESGSVSDGEVVESQIDGDFEGFEGETIIKLMNGQIWQQSEYWYHYHYSFMPKVLIYKQGDMYKMKVDGVDKSVGVIRLN